MSADEVALVIKVFSRLSVWAPVERLPDPALQVREGDTASKIAFAPGGNDYLLLK
jgi:hypothetical protein